MKTLINIQYFLLFIVLSAQGQQKEKSAPVELNIESTSYPTFLGNEQHKTLNFELVSDSNFQLELNNSYDNYPLENRMRSALNLKKFVDKNFYGLVGADVEWRVGRI